MTSGRIFHCVAIVAVAGVLALGTSTARADIINGDFSDGLNSGWGIVANPPGYTEVVDGRLHIVSYNTYEWNSDVETWDLQDATESGINVLQSVLQEAGYWAPEGTDAIEFDVEVTITDNPVGNPGAGTMFAINYGGNAASTGLLTDYNGTVLLPLPGLVPNDPGGCQLSVVSYAGLDVSPDPGLGTSYTITVESYFDNFQFVPEPASVLVLAMGALAMIARRRRRS